VLFFLKLSEDYSTTTLINRQAHFFITWISITFRYWNLQYVNTGNHWKSLLCLLFMCPFRST